MSGPAIPRRTIVCSCGSVEFEVLGTPIVTAACYCQDCQAGSRQIEALPQAPAILDEQGGTAYVVFRKDRVRCIKGADFLKGHKIREKTVTNRVVATCCNSAMLMNFDDSKHWVDVYRSRFSPDPPPLEIRICTKTKTGGDLPSDVPSYGSYPPRFLVKILAAKLAMLFGR